MSSAKQKSLGNLAFGRPWIRKEQRSLVTRHDGNGYTGFIFPVGAPFEWRRSWRDGYRNRIRSLVCVGPDGTGRQGTASTIHFLQEFNRMNFPNNPSNKTTSNQRLAQIDSIIGATTFQRLRPWRLKSASSRKQSINPPSGSNAKRGERVKPPSLSGSMSGAGDGSKKSVAGNVIGSPEKTTRPKSCPSCALHLGQLSDMLCLHGTQPDRLKR